MHAIRQRPINQDVYLKALVSGYSDIQARVIAGRLDTNSPAPLAQLMSPPLSALDPPSLLPDIEAAVTRIVRAITGGETLVCVADHDCDGSNSSAVVYRALTEYFGVPAAQVRCYVSHRLREGYGVSDALTDRILSEVSRPALVITADQGTTDEPRIAKLKANGIDTVVTDHHELPEAGVPQSAVACVNPTRPDARFPDPYICGCHVAWLVMCAVRERLIEVGHLPASTPKLSALSAYVATAAIADCVNMATSPNNRAIVRYGLSLMNSKPQACWSALARVCNVGGPITSETLGFKFGPTLNCCGRLDDAMRSVDLLLCNDRDQSMLMAAELDEQNRIRKEMQAAQVATARAIAQIQADAGHAALVVYLPDGHAGIHGITASRLTDAFGRPAVCFSPKLGEPGIATGSLRSIDGVDIFKALSAVDAQVPGVLIRFGGHKGAGGCQVRVEDIDTFADAFRQAVACQRAPETMEPVVETDGVISRPLGLDLLDELVALEPYGKRFPAPVFSGEFTIRSAKAVGDGTHIKLELMTPHRQTVSAIWFSARSADDDGLPVTTGERVELAYTLAANTYRTPATLDLQIKACRSLEFAR